jgi:hypothetical protein
MALKKLCDQTKLLTSQNCDFYGGDLCGNTTGENYEEEIL